MMSKKSSKGETEEAIPPYLQVVMLSFVGLLVAVFLLGHDIPPYLVGVLMGCGGILVLLKYPSVWKKKKEVNEN